MSFVVVGCQLVSMSEFHSTRLGVPAVMADDVTSLIGHVVGVFAPHLGALCDAYDTYLAGIDDAGATMRQLLETNPAFTHCIYVIVVLYIICLLEYFIITSARRYYDPSCVLVS